jgi:Asp-tRNA(Asn)/Glu-tRNA(Gln) amidotransferase A subunit family amidase
LDLIVTPTLAFVAPPAFTDDREIRDSVLRLPASVQLVAPAGEDARVLAAGALLERALGSAGQS